MTPNFFFGLCTKYSTILFKTTNECDDMRIFRGFDLNLDNFNLIQYSNECYVLFVGDFFFSNFLFYLIVCKDDITDMIEMNVYTTG